MRSASAVAASASASDAVAAGHDGHAGGGHFAPRLLFFAHQPQHVGRRTDEGDVRGLADFGEIGVFGEEAVAGMDGVDVGDFRGADDVRDVQIAFGAARRADADGFVGKPHVQRVAVGFGIDGDGGNAQFLAGANHPQGDFAAVGNQNFAEHHGRKITPGGYFFFSPAGWQRAAGRIRPAGHFRPARATISPPTSASISFISFIASTMQTTCPALNCCRQLSQRARRPGWATNRTCPQSAT